VVVDDLNRESSLADPVVEAMLTGGDVKLPAVPGACDDSAANGAGPQGATGMGADAVQHMPFAIGVEDGEHAILGYNFR
jgi:hypothetical protein